MRRTARHWGTLLVALALLATACGGGGSDEGTIEATFTSPRTYEQLDLSGPEAAVTEFTTAFVRRDYVTAALILHPDTQRAMTAAAAAGDLSGLITVDAEPSVQARVAIERGADHHLDALRIFEIAMEEAMSNGGLRVDLASGVDAVTVLRQDQFTAVVEAILSTNGNDVVFELAPTSDRRWRIRGARLTSGTPLQVPFSGEPTIESPSRGTEERDVWRRALPNGSLQELLDTVAVLAAAGDHVSIYLLLDSQGQRGAGELLASSTTPDHGLIAAMLDARLDAAGFPVDFAGMKRVGGDFVARAETLGSGDAMTILVTVASGDLDVTVSLDSTGGWRLRRIVPAGELTAPTPFALG